MPRRSLRSKASTQGDEHEFDKEEEEQEKEEEEERPSPPKRGRRRVVVEEEEEDEEIEEKGVDEEGGKRSTMTMEPTQSSLGIMSQNPEQSQSILPPREVERVKFFKLSEERREKAVTDVLRLVLFRAFAGEPIDRLKVAKDAGIGEDKISSAVLEEVNVRLENIFGFRLLRAPAFLYKMKDFPARCKERYYLVNTVQDESGHHLKAIHAVHRNSSIEKGLLMVVLAFIFCKGDARSDGSRWILDKELFRLLNTMDENLPGSPPEPGTSKQRYQIDGILDVDGALERFVKMDYLLKIKANEQLLTINDQADDASFFYAMGARSAIEVGRLQVVHFISQTLGEEVAPEILKEIENDGVDDE